MAGVLLRRRGQNDITGMLLRRRGKRRYYRYCADEMRTNVGITGMLLMR